jgi:hypothetical protein
MVENVWEDRIGAVAFIYRSGALLNRHVHFHCVVVEGVFESDASGGAHFHEAHALGPEVVGEIQAKLRIHLLRALTRRGLLEREDAQAMGAWDYGGSRLTRCQPMDGVKQDGRLNDIHFDWTR